MPRLSLAVLGPIQISLDGQSISGFAYSKARALLLYLAVEADRPHQREALVSLLWPDLPEQAGRTNLRQALASLRAALGDSDDSPSPPFLLITRDSLQFNPAGDYELDAGAFEALLAASRAHPHRQLRRCRSCLARLAEAAALYRGDFLSEFSLADSQAFSEWELIRRERLHQRGLEALATLASYHDRRGAGELARHYAQRQVELDPWHEEAHRHLMVMLARAGQRSAALAQYEICRQVLAEALGVEPTPETQKLYRRIRDDDDSNRLAADPQAAGRNVALPATLPLGRQPELGELAGLLENPAHRLVTLVGPGGIGKTCLAQLTAHELADTFEDGAAFVALAGLATADQLPSAILLALDVPLAGAADPWAKVTGALRERELLLVLDNFDHLLDPNGEAVQRLAELLRDAPRLTILATSRERLGLKAEWVFDLEGLPVPPAVQPPASIESFGAVQLFVERARQAQRQFVLDAETSPAVARICQLVEGLPLAIELAAAQVRASNCARIADEIDANLREYTNTLRDVPERHHSLWATFEYSWQLLAPAAQGVLARLAVFSGGFDAEAAEGAASADVRQLAALADKSLLRQARHNREAAGQAPRFELHETTRQYALRKLEAASELDAARLAHASYFMGLAETAAPQLTGGSQVAWLDRLEREHANLRAALHWTLATAEAETAGRIGAALWRFWWLHGHLVEGRAWLAQIGALGAAVPPGVRANVFNGAGVLANDLGHHAAALASHQQALAIRRAMNDQLGMARSLGNMGNTVRQLGEKAQARAYFTECLAIFRALEHQWGIATTVLNLGVMWEEDDPDQTVALYAESLALYRQLGDQHGASIVIGNMGEVALRKRDYPGARRLYAEYLTISRAVGDTPSVAHGLMMIGIIALEEKQTQRGVRYLGSAARLRETIGVPVLSAWNGEYERCLGAARAALSEPDFAAAWAEGAGATLEQALQF